MTPNKLDLSKKLKPYFTAKLQPQLIEIESAQYISILGKGDPSSAEFAKHIEALYTLAFAIKFECKSRNQDFVVSKLEGQWWYDVQKFGKPRMSEAPKLIPRSEWEYRLLIMMPDFVDAALIENKIELCFTKKGIPEIKQIELITLNEGLCIQLLHVGPYDTESESLLKILEFSATTNLVQNGHHHEIYLSDFRKTPAEKLKTILREPVLRSE